MRSSNDRTSSQLPNAFSSRFLRRFSERDEPLTAGEADAAGPWFIEEIPAIGFGLFRAGESLSRGFRPAAVFPDRWLALVAAAVLPGTGRDPLFRLQTEPDASGGYGVALDDGAVVGHLDLFDEPLVDAVNMAVNLARRRVTLQAPASSPPVPARSQKGPAGSSPVPAGFSPAARPRRAATALQDYGPQSGLAAT